MVMTFFLSLVSFVYIILRSRRLFLVRVEYRNNLWQRKLQKLGRKADEITSSKTKRKANGVCHVAPK